MPKPHLAPSHSYFIQLGYFTHQSHPPTHFTASRGLLLGGVTLMFWRRGRGASTLLLLLMLLLMLLLVLLWLFVNVTVGVTVDVTVGVAVDVTVTVEYR